MSVKFDAFAIGMQAQVGRLDDFDVDALVEKSEQLLGSNDVLSRAITGFATQHQLVKYDAARLRELGRNLVAFIDTLNMPEPPDLGRKDIHG